MTTTSADGKFALNSDFLNSLTGDPELRPIAGDHPDPAPVPVPTFTTLADPETTFGLIEFLLKDQSQLNRLSRSPARQRRLIPGLLAIGVSGYAIFSVVLSIIFCCAGVWPELTSIADWLRNTRQPLITFAPLGTGGIWGLLLSGSMLHLLLAYVLGLIGAIGICLPSFYFYSLLAGVRTSMLQVTTSALQGMASGAIAVLGTLPIYLAVMLGLIILNASPEKIEFACFTGLLLPFITGLYGTQSLYMGFMSLAKESSGSRARSGEFFLKRLLLAWSGCYTAVTPVMIFALWEYMGR